MARRRKTDGPSAGDAQARRLVGLMVAFSNARNPLTSEEVRAAHYPDLSPDSFLRQFSRDRQRLAEAGLVIVRERHGRDEALWQAASGSFADMDALSPADALMIDVLCSQLVSDPTFAQRSELRHALAKLDGAYGEVTAARVEGEGSSTPAFVVLLDCMARRRVALVRYVDAAGRQSERAYAPFGTFGLRDHTYIVCAIADEADGVDADELRTLRDDRLLGVRMQARGYEIPKDFSAQDHRRLPFQIGPTTCAILLRATEGVSDTTRAELSRCARTPRGEGHDELWEVDCSSVDDAAAWSIAEGVLPRAPKELVDAWASRLEAAEKLEAWQGMLPIDAVGGAAARTVSPVASKAKEAQARELIALVGSLRTQGAALSASGVSARLGIPIERARELIALVLSSCVGSDAQLPLALSDDEDELTLCFDRGVRGRPLRLTHAEATALEAALDTLGFDADDPLRQEILRAFGPTDITAEEARRRVEPVLAPEANERLEACSRALIDGAALGFSYQGGSEGAPLRRKVLPMAIRTDEGYWYLDAHDLDRDARRTFRMDRMSDVRVMSAPRTVPDQEDEDEGRTVTIAFSDQHLLELLAWPRLEVVSRDDSTIVATIPYYGGSWLPRRLAACGGTAVTSDEDLAEATRAIARRLLELGSRK